MIVNVDNKVMNIIPVSRKAIPSFLASVRPTVVFPEATGPSMGTLILARLKYSAP